MTIEGEQVHGDIVRYSAETLEAAQKNSLLPATPFEWEEHEPDHFRAIIEVVKGERVKRWICTIEPE